MSKRVVLITGCSQPDSLGVALGTTLQQRGCEVYCTARKTDSAGIQAAVASGCKALALDVTSQSSVDDALEELSQQTGGKLDILINNSLFGPVRMIQACVPLMLSHPAQSSSQTKGKERKPMIVNIGSQAAVGIPWQAGYSSSKAACNAISDLLQLEVQGLGIEVVTVVAGSFRTYNMSQTVQDPLPPSKFYPTIESLNSTILKTFTKISQSAPSVETVSAGIVSRLESGQGGRMYTGAGSFAARYVLGYLPHSTVGKIIGDMFGVGLVAPPTAEQLRAGTIWKP